MPKSRRNGKQSASPADPAQEPPLGKALFRVMRAIVFDEKPLSELDALPMAQMRLLWPVHYCPGSTMKDYSERLRVSQSTLTQLADSLVRRSLIERYHDETDRRIVRLQLSEKGQVLMDAANRRREETLRGVWAELSELEQEQIMSSLETLARVGENVRLKLGRPVTPLPGFELDEGKTENSNESAQPVMDILSRRVRGNSP